MKRPSGQRLLPKIFGSAFWSACDFWVQQASALLVFIVVGNLVGPGAVGVVTMAQLVITLLMTLLLDGFSDALIQRERLDPEHFDTAFWLLLGCGTTACLALLAGAPAISALFGEPELTHVLRLMALGLPFVGITATYHGILQRDLRFRTLATRTILAQSSGFACALAMAHRGYGADSLVGYFLVSRLMEAALIVPVSRVFPGIRVSRAALADIVGFGKHRVGNQFVGFVVMQIDRFSTSLFLGPVAVGLYSVAERITSAMINGLSGVLGRVAFPVLSSRQSDEVAFARSFRNFLGVIAVLAFPVFTGIAVTSKEIVGVLFNPSWAASAPLVAIVALAGLPHAANYLFTAGISARGRPDITVRYSLIIMGMRLVCSMIAAQFGLIAVAWANLGVTLFSTGVVVRAVGERIPGGAAMLLDAAWAPALAAAAMSAVTLWLGALLGPAPALLLLVAKIGIGVVTYPAALLLLAPRTVTRHLPRFAGSA